MTTNVQVGTIPEWTIADRFRKAREQATLSQLELAQRTGLSRRTVIMIERSDRRPRRKEYLLWHLATGVPLFWLARGEVPPPNDPDELPGLDSNQEPIGIKPAPDFRGFRAMSSRPAVA